MTEDERILRQILHLVDEFCEGYCKYREIYRCDESDENYDRMAEEVCDKCPMMRF